MIEEFNKEILIQYVCKSWLNGLEIDKEVSIDNNGNTILIIDFKEPGQTIVIKVDDFVNIIIPEAHKRISQPHPPKGGCLSLTT